MKWDYNPDRGFALLAQHRYVGSSSTGAINAGLFWNYCVGVEIAGFGYTTAETETRTQVNDLELLAKLGVRQVWQSTNQNNNLTVIASWEDRRLRAWNWVLVRWQRNGFDSKQFHAKSE